MLRVHHDGRAAIASLGRAAIASLGHRVCRPPRRFSTVALAAGDERLWKPLPSQRLEQHLRHLGTLHKHQGRLVTTSLA